MRKTRQELVGQVADAVRAYQRATDALDDAVARILDVNRTDMRCLDWLFDGPLTTGELASAAGISAAAMTTVVDRLTAKGLVRRTADPEDRRRVIIEVTPEFTGRAMALYGPLVADGGAILGRYRIADLELLRDYFTIITELSEKHRVRISEEG